MAYWTTNNIPDQSGRVFLITGANSGIGYEAAAALAAKHATVIMAVRTPERGAAAAAQITQRYPQAQLDVQQLDLADLQNIRDFAARITQRYPQIDGLINNAGVMAIPLRHTADGFEMQFGTNHLGHFALTGLLLPLVFESEHGRVVTVSSSAHMTGVIDFANLDASNGYKRWVAYCQSKLANLLFAYDLQRRVAEIGSHVISVACHPGYSATNLQLVGPQMDGMGWAIGLMNGINAVMAQNAAMGALPTLYAAISGDVVGGDYIGPNGLMNMRGYPIRHASSARSHDPLLAERLWQVSEELTGVRYEHLMVAQ